MTKLLLSGTMVLLGTFCLSQNKINNIRATYFYSDIQQCELSSRKCSSQKSQPTSVFFDIGNEGAGTIKIVTFDKFATKIIDNNVEYKSYGSIITFMTDKGNKVVWYIDGNNQSKSLTLVIPQMNLSYSFTNLED